VIGKNRDSPVMVEVGKGHSRVVIRSLALAEWLQHRCLVRLVASAGLLLTGCIYLDPIVSVPTLLIDPVQPGDGRATYRGDRVMLTAHYSQDRNAGTYTWSALACNDVRAEHCDPVPFDGTSLATPDWQFDVPRRDAIQGILVRLDASDDRGVHTQATKLYAIDDKPPTLELRKSAHSLTVGAPIDLFAKYGDPDDPVDRIVLDWYVFTPSTQPAWSLDDVGPLDDPNDIDHITAHYRLVPHGSGDWEVHVVAHDPRGALFERTVMLPVVPDRPPCLAQWQPIAAPDGATLPIADPTVFQVPLVDDDLDGYPAQVGDPIFGTTEFAWSILPPGASVRQPLVGATGNSIDFDPGAFTPGDRVEIRVEIFDRNHTAIPCVDGAATCSVISQPSCIQRLTWAVEIR
jgi:hypothetical protein